MLLSKKIFFLMHKTWTALELIVMSFGIYLNVAKKTLPKIRLLNPIARL